MRIRITTTDPDRPAWFNDHVGEECEAHGSLENEELRERLGESEEGVTLPLA